MLKRIRIRRPSPALVVAFIALFVAGAGTAGAARLITGKQIKNSSITSSDIKDRSLLKKDFKPGQLPAGPAGPQGLQGAAGRAGRDGFGTLDYEAVAGPLDTNDGAPGGTDEVKNAFAGCPDGLSPTGGDAQAYAVDAQDNPDFETPLDIPTFGVGFGQDSTSGSVGWFASFKNPSTTDRAYVIVDVVCANATTTNLQAAKMKRVAARNFR